MYLCLLLQLPNELLYDKFNDLGCASSKDSDQYGHALADLSLLCVERALSHSDSNRPGVDYIGK